MAGPEKVHIKFSTGEKIYKTLVLVVAPSVAAFVLLGSTCGMFNKAPSVPEISGPSAGAVGVPVDPTVVMGI
ncbi:hypothetical protein CH330_04610 [candidate division WOR-3 bacterium JGI_Cruoil_03_51_56]|uniref:Uncharacterized protein n=1 Tax=candidate division WOR-3 bacterium JGI_Cruoil_03_51_56 TaxID=1973747 RepID=A0A235BVR1_UNCW3|nr:MAG: hypothetical protein CH330_04610 [candidate division WOR-3 bacterium JGI_Cruoil_03_51_56]